MVVVFLYKEDTLYVEDTSLCRLKAFSYQRGRLDSHRQFFFKKQKKQKIYIYINQNKCMNVNNPADGQTPLARERESGKDLSFSFLSSSFLFENNCCPPGMEKSLLFML